MKLCVIILVASINWFLSNWTISIVAGSLWIITAVSKVTIGGLTEASSRVRPVIVRFRGA